MKCCQRLLSFSVVVRVVAAILNIVTVCLWGVCGTGAVPPYKSPAGHVLFSHAIAGCLFTLPTLVLADTLLGETPGPWMQRVFLLTGVVLLLPLGSVGVYISARGGALLQASVAALCLAVSILMLADFIYVEKLYC